MQGKFFRFWSVLCIWYVGSHLDIACFQIPHCHNERFFFIFITGLILKRSEPWVQVCSHRTWYVGVEIDFLSVCPTRNEIIVNMSITTAKSCRSFQCFELKRKDLQTFRCSYKEFLCCAQANLTTDQWNKNGANRRNTGPSNLKGLYKIY